MKPMLEDKVAILTGSGRGIGAAAARLFSQEGARLVLNDLDEEPINQLAGEIEEQGGQVKVVSGDVTDPALPPLLVSTAEETWGRLDILLNNAGYTWDGTIHKMGEDQWQAMLDVHLTAVFRLIRSAAPYMRERAKEEIAQAGQAQARKIITISSTSGTRGNFGQTNYSAAKAGLIGLTKTMAKEWGAFNIQVNCAAFGFIDTRLTQEKEEGSKTVRDDVEISLGIPEGIRSIGIQMIPMGRPGTPEEAAGALLFLASNLSDYVSGQILEVTGGT